MANKSSTFANDILKYVFDGTVPSWASNTDFYVGLHTADPGVGGNQSTNEVSYTGYYRVAVSRVGLAWYVSGGTVTNASEITFGQCTAGTPTITHVSIGTASSGVGQILYSSALASPVTLSVGQIPKFNASTLTGTES